MKIAAFIDGANLYAGSKAIGLDIDYSRMLEFLRQRGDLVRAFYYTALLEDGEFSPIRPLIDWLGYNGFSMVTKAAKEFVCPTTGRRKIKGNMDIELACDMMEMAACVDHIYLFSGDGDFRRVVDAVQRKGVRVTVISSLSSQPPMIADELRRQADEFIDLAKVGDDLKKLPKENENEKTSFTSGAYGRTVPSVSMRNNKTPVPA